MICAHHPDARGATAGGGGGAADGAERGWRAACSGSRAVNRALPLAVAAAALIAAPAARAQGTDPAAAQGLFDEAKQLVAQGRIAEACPKFVASFKLDPKPGTAVNLADCLERSG